MRTVPSRGIAVIVLLLVACSSSTGPGTGQLTPDEIDAFTAQFAGAMGSGVLQASSMTASAREAAAPSAATGTPINVPLNKTTTCPAGGSIQVTGSLVGTVDANVTGTLSLYATETITHWLCVASRVMDGQLTLGGSFPLTNGHFSTTATITLSGTFRWGSLAQNLCTVDVTMQLKPDGSGQATGTVCGRPVNKAVAATADPHRCDPYAGDYAGLLAYKWTDFTVVPNTSGSGTISLSFSATCGQLSGRVGDTILVSITRASSNFAPFGTGTGSVTTGATDLMFMPANPPATGNSLAYGILISFPNGTGVALWGPLTVTGGAFIIANDLTNSMAWDYSIPSAPLTKLPGVPDHGSLVEMTFKINHL